jgi:hypothetical protein
VAVAWQVGPCNMGIIFYLLALWSEILIKYLRIGSKTSNWFDNLTQRIITFSLVSFAWIFFRARDLNQALYIVIHLFDNIGRDIVMLIYNLNFDYIKHLMIENEKMLGLSLNNWIIMTSAIVVMYFIHELQNKKNINELLESVPVVFRWAIYYVLLIVIFYYAAQGQEHFIYFQF